MAHAMVYGGGEQLLIGFEDVLGGGDFDYNDLMFSFSNVAGDDTVVGVGSGGVAVVAVDEPGTLVLLGSGLSMLVVVMRRQRSKV